MHSYMRIFFACLSPQTERANANAIHSNEKRIVWNAFCYRSNEKFNLKNA